MNAYDAAFQGRVKFDQDRALTEQERQANDMKLKRQPILDQRADDTYNRGVKADDLAIADAARARQNEIDTAKRQAQMRGLQTLKTAVANGMEPGQAIAALGPGGLKAFGDTFGDMASFAQKAKDPRFLDAQIAGLMDDPTKLNDYDAAPGLPGVTRRGNKFYDADGNPLSAATVRKMQLDAQGSAKTPWTMVAPGVAYNRSTNTYSEDPDILDMVQTGAFAKARGTAAGKGAGENDVDSQPWTPMQALDAKAAIGIGQQKFGNFTNAIDLALSQTDWTSAGVIGNLKSIGGAPANLASTLNTIKANIGLDELLKLKAAGGTLGQVTTAEHELLQGLIADLSQTQDPDQLKRKLAYIRQQAEGSWQRVMDIYRETASIRGGGGQGGGQPGGGAPDPQAIGTPGRAVDRHKKYDY